MLPPIGLFREWATGRKGSRASPACNFIEQLRLLWANTLDMPQFCRHNHMLDGERVKKGIIWQEESFYLRACFLSP